MEGRLASLLVRGVSAAPACRANFSVFKNQKRAPNYQGTLIPPSPLIVLIIAENCQF